MSFGWTIDINADSGSIKIFLYYDPKKHWGPKEYQYLYTRAEFFN